MTRLDDVVRTGLTQAAETVSVRSTDQLAHQLAERRSRAQRRTRVARTVIGAAAVFVALAAIAVVLNRSDEDPDRVDTVVLPVDDRGFASYPPGWHEFDVGPASKARSSSLAWTGRELAVATVPDGATRPRVFAYSPTDRSWRSLGEVPIQGDVTIAWAGERLVAIGRSFPTATAAVWDSGDARWRELGHPPIPEAMVSPRTEGCGPTAPCASWGGPRTVTSNLQLVWTGQRLLDLTHGAALDPESGRWMTLAVPEDLTPYLHLTGATTPVWDGTEVLLTGWTSAPGLAWTPTGSAYREIPGIPAEVFVNEVYDGSEVVHDSVATSHHGRLLLVSGAGDGTAATFDGRTDTWRREATPAGLRPAGMCPSLAATVAARAVVMPCEGDAPAVLGDGGWAPTGPPPFSVECCGVEWIDAGGALVVFMSVGDIDGRLAQAPDARVAVWVPPDS
jgi:hypothetical protein